MTCVEKVVRLSHPGVLHTFAWPAGLADFARFNLIYGWNGSGKTTLSRAFRDLELHRAPTDCNVTLRVDAADVWGGNFGSSTAQVRVFNRDFIAESVFPTGGGAVPPIFVVGKENVEKQKELERLQGELRAASGRLTTAEEELRSAERGLDNYCVGEAKRIKDRLRSTGSAYNEYDKRQYKIRATKMLADGDAQHYALDEPTHERLDAQRVANPKPELAEVSYVEPRLHDLADATEKLLAATVVSASIQALVDDASLASWVKEGLGLHERKHAVECLFCGGKLDPARIDALNAHFNAEYDRLQQRIDAQVADLEREKAVLHGLQLPDQAHLYDDLASGYADAKASLERDADSGQEILQLLVNALQGKKSQPFTSVELGLCVLDTRVDRVDEINQVIRTHNGTCRDFVRKVRDARDSLALSSIADGLDDYKRLQDVLGAAKNAVSPIQADVSKLKGQIAVLEREIREQQRPADELNADLKRYLGHGELQLVVRGTGYEITRGSEPAKALSEGEATAIALLYFLKSLEDRGFDKKNGVVVIDDPVSSLDANALYLAFGFIRQRTDAVGQLFILTHNFEFFRQVKNWFHHLQGQSKRDASLRPARFYMLGRSPGASRSSTLMPLDPLLEQYESEYHYLFACVLRAVQAGPGADLESSYHLPNVARRLLETFLAFRRPQSSGELWKKLKDVPFDEARKARVIRFVHTHSHSDAVGAPQHDLSLLSEACPVLADLLDLIRAEDSQHYEAMVRLICGGGADGDLV